MKQELQEKQFDSRLHWKAWKRLLSFTKPYKVKVVLLVVVAIILAVLETSLTLVARNMVDSLWTEGEKFELAPFVMQFTFVVIGICFLVWSFINLAGFLSSRLSHDIRKTAFEKLQDLSISYFDERPVGWLMARMTSDSERLVQILTWGAVDFLWGITFMIVMTAVMLYLNIKLALLVLISIPCLFAISSFFEKRLLGSSRQIRKINSKLTASYNELLMGLKTTKSLNFEEKNYSDFESLAASMHRSSVVYALQAALYLPLTLTVGSAALAFVLWEGGVLVFSDALSMGTFVAFISYATQFFHPVERIAAIFAEFQYAQASAERIVDLIETEPKIKDSKKVEEKIREFNSEAHPEIALDGGRQVISKIVFDSVDFKYPNGQAVLHDFCLEIDAGKTVALVGETGSGKSTIVNLLCRFHEPSNGQILFDGVDYRDRSLQWLQSILGIVLQDPQLFSGTIKENIRYGRLDATDQEVEEAAGLVHAKDFILNLEDGFDTDVGEGGSLLSVGQRQLISFARAILADPQIFVMDEATSSIDTQTEQVIQSGLNQLLKGRTSFVIAHRLSTIRGADLILVIDQGKIVEAGHHRELLNRGGYYANLYHKHAG